MFDVFLRKENMMIKYKCIVYCLLSYILLTLNAFSEPFIYVKECSRKCNGVNIREHATEYSKKNGFLESGEKVRKLNEKDGWYYIEKKTGTVGWVNMHYMKEEEPQSNIISRLESKITQLEKVISEKTISSEQLNQRILKLNDEIRMIKKDLVSSKQTNQKLQEQIIMCEKLEKNAEKIKQNYDETYQLLQKSQSSKFFLKIFVWFLVITNAGGGYYIFRLKKEIETIHL